MNSDWEDYDRVDIGTERARHAELFDYIRAQMALSQKSFLLIGDTNHHDPLTQIFLDSPELAALLHYARIPHVCIENRREVVTPERLECYAKTVERWRRGEIQSEAVDGAEKDFWKSYQATCHDWASRFHLMEHTDELRRLNEAIAKVQSRVEKGKLSPTQGKNLLTKFFNQASASDEDYWGKQIIGFTRAGLSVTAADSWQWFPSIVPSLMERLFLGDREIADYVRRQAAGRKTAIIYGAAHFRYEGCMQTHLDPDQCVHLEIYANRRDYKVARMQNTHVDYIPDRIYLLRERLLEVPDPFLYRHGASNDDLYQRQKDYVRTIYGENGVDQENITCLPGTNPDYLKLKA